MNTFLYCPRLSNGKKVRLRWPIQIYRWTNIICWPLEDNVPRWFYVLDRFLWLLAFVIFIMHNEAEIRYFKLNLNNLDELLTGVPTYLVLIEIHIRAFTLGLKKEKFKKFLQLFFAKIYIERSVNSKLYEEISLQIRPILIFSTLYLCALITYTIIPIYLLYTGQRELLYKMIPPVDYKEYMYIYLPLLVSNIWVGSLVATIMFGEANILAVLIFHLNGRYILMRQNFHHKVERILTNNVNSNVRTLYRQVLLETLEENLRLNKFAGDIQNEFSFGIFIIFGFSAISLCALGFKVFTSPMTSIGYMFWAVGKIQETIAFGRMGSTIISTTNNISSMYYESKWESVIERSSDFKENVHLMRLITLAMVINQQPFNFTGLNFFVISLSSVVKILQGAVSYFTCLISLRKQD